MNNKYIAKVNDQHDIVVDRESLDQVDINIGHDGYIHVIDNHQSYRAELIDYNKSSKTITIKLNNATYSVILKDDLDQLVTSMGMKANLSRQSADVIAPMPGLVLKVLVEEGQTINEGDPVLILEAMKMENVLKADGEGKIIGIHASEGDSVEKGTLLIEVDND